MITVTSGAAQRAFLQVCFRNVRRFPVSVEVVCCVSVRIGPLDCRRNPRLAIDQLRDHRPGLIAERDECITRSAYMGSYIFPAVLLA